MKRDRVSGEHGSRMRRLPDSDRRHVSPKGTHRLVTRDAKLLAVDQENRNETLLASSPPDRNVIIAIQSGVRTAHELYSLRPTLPTCDSGRCWCPATRLTRRFSNIALPEWADDIEKLRIGVVNADGTATDVAANRVPRGRNLFGTSRMGGQLRRSARRKVQSLPGQA